LRVEDAFQQVLGALTLFEQAQRSLGNPHAAFVWRLEKASTESPFTVVAVADPLDPAIDVTPQVIRAKALVADGVCNLVARAEPPPRLPRAELEIVAQRAGWQIVEFYEDAGISGSRGRDRRPAFDRLLKDATRRRFDLITAWLVDRLGRSLQDLVGFLSEIHGAGVDLYLPGRRSTLRPQPARCGFRGKSPANPR
jgi:Resolvase, N terminal domain